MAGEGLDLANVRATRLLGHELRTLPLHCRIGGEHARQQVTLEFRARILADQVNGGVRHADRTHEAELALHEKILAGVLGNWWQGDIKPECAGAVAHGVELKVTERDRL